MIVYVKLLDEGSIMYRPVEADELGKGLYRLGTPEDYDPDDERWDFLPGSIVRGELRRFIEGAGVVATGFVGKP